MKSKKIRWCGRKKRQLCGILFIESCLVAESCTQKLTKTCKELFTLVQHFPGECFIFNMFRSVVFLIKQSTVYILKGFPRVLLLLMQDVPLQYRRSVMTVSDLKEIQFDTICPAFIVKCLCKPLRIQSNGCMSYTHI